MRRWTWAAASQRGTSHQLDGSRCQDAYACFVVRGTFVAILADGAGSAQKGGQGAWIATRVISQLVRQHLSRSSRSPTEDQVLDWLDEARDAIGRAAGNRELAPRDFASTLIVNILQPEETTVVHVGDGCAVGRVDSSSEWIALTWPAHGEFASSTHFLTEDPEARVAIARHVLGMSQVVAFTDGLERLALDFTAQRPHTPYFDGMIGPIQSSSVVGRDAGLSMQLAKYLDSSAINERTDDDKTLVIATRK